MAASKAKAAIRWSLIAALMNLALIHTFCEAIAFDEVSSLHIWITVSSLAPRGPGSSSSKPILFRQIELNWINAPLDEPNDYIALYLDAHPGEQPEAQPVSVHKLNGRMNGKLTTDYYLPMINFMNETRLVAHPSDQEREVEYDIEAPVGPDQEPLGGATGAWHQYSNTYGPLSRRGLVNAWADRGGQSQQRGRRRKSITPGAQLMDECVGYCIAYHSQAKILATNCLTTQPNWMQESRSTSRSLPSLMLPGTHNSATYPRQLDKTVLQIINKYQINQDESIFNQLIYGIRYLDLRVGHSKVKQRPEELWIYHDIFRTDVSVEEVFEQVARFLELTTHEIIVMDFHRFTVGFQNEQLQVQRERHAKLIDLLFRHLGQYIIPSYLGQHAPLNEYIAMGKRLVVGYASRSQLLGAQADNGHSSMFGLYSTAAQAASKKTAQVRDIDAINDEPPADVAHANNPHDSNGAAAAAAAADQVDLQPDRRMGTRIYNRLKSLKLISRQFSKRSIEGQESPLATITTIAGNKYRKLTPNSRLKEPTKTTANDDDRHRQPITVSAQLMEFHGGDTAGPSSSLDAMSSLSSRLALLFPPVKHLWPNKDTIEGLAQYMNETTCRKYFGELRSMMVELTPTVFGAISDKYDGNRRLADLANRPVTDWIRARWLHCMNIVASDFFLGNDLIKLSVWANRMRLSSRQGHVGDMSSLEGAGGQCRSFRRIEHLLDKARIAASQQHNQQVQSVTAMNSNNNSNQPANSDGISELYSFFKRIFNL